jgi:hypothetical protein
LPLFQTSKKCLPKSLEKPKCKKVYAILALFQTGDSNFGSPPKKTDAMYDIMSLNAGMFFTSIYIFYANNMRMLGIAKCENILEST